MLYSELIPCKICTSYNLLNDIQDKPTLSYCVELTSFYKEFKMKMNRKVIEMENKKRLDLEPLTKLTFRIYH